MYITFIGSLFTWNILRLCCYLNEFCKLYFLKAEKQRLEIKEEID